MHNAHRGQTSYNTYLRCSGVAAGSNRICSLDLKPPCGFTLFSYSRSIFFISHPRLPPPIEKRTDSFSSLKPRTEGALEASGPTKPSKKRNKKKSNNKQAVDQGGKSKMEADKAIVGEDNEEGGGRGSVDSAQPRSLRLRLDLRQQRIVPTTAVPMVPPSSNSPSLPLRLRLSFSPTATTVSMEEWSAEILKEAFPTGLKKNRRASG